MSDDKEQPVSPPKVDEAPADQSKSTTSGAEEAKPEAENKNEKLARDASEAIPNAQGASEGIAKAEKVDWAAAPPSRDSAERTKSSSQAQKDEPTEEPADATAKRAADAPKPKRTPYVNPDRFKTGGPQRDKLTPEELAERMDRIRLNNERIKERRLAVQADEQAFAAVQAQAKQKEATNRKIQENINRSREQNARRKMEKISIREWDNNKKVQGQGPPGPRGRGGGAQVQSPSTTKPPTPGPTADAPTPAATASAEAS